MHLGLEDLLENHKYTIDLCLRLHYFVVDYRKDGKEKEDVIMLFLEEELDVTCDDFLSANPLEVTGTLNEEPVFQGTRGYKTSERQHQEIKKLI